MSTWTDMSYDEQRKALGLADVRAAVAAYQLAAAWRGAARAVAAWGEAWRKAWKP